MLNTKKRETPNTSPRRRNDDPRWIEHLRIGEELRAERAALAEELGQSETTLHTPDAQENRIAAAAKNLLAKVRGRLATASPPTPPIDFGVVQERIEAAEQLLAAHERQGVSLRTHICGRTLAGLCARSHRLATRDFSESMHGRGSLHKVESPPITGSAEWCFDEPVRSLRTVSKL